MHIEGDADLRQGISEAFAASVDAQQRCLDSLVAPVAALGALLLATIERRGTVFWIGNGGSAAQAQHAAAELMGRFRASRRPLAALSLTDDAVLTGVANDFGYDQLYARQLSALARPGDLVVGLSTSGKSRNILVALEVARERGAATAALTGADPEALELRCDVVVSAGSSHTGHIQEAHLAIIHALCGIVEARLPERE